MQDSKFVIVLYDNKRKQTLAYILSALLLLIIPLKYDNLPNSLKEGEYRISLFYLYMLYANASSSTVSLSSIFLCHFLFKFLFLKNISEQGVFSSIFLKKRHLHQTCLIASQCSSITSLSNCLNPDTQRTEFSLLCSLHHTHLFWSLESLCLSYFLTQIYSSLSLSISEQNVMANYEQRETETLKNALL